MQRRSTQGVVFVHACPKALCQHVEWALERVVGAPVSLSWADQPAAHGSYRAEVAWTGAPGTGAKLVAALKAWPMLRFEVTEEPSPGVDGERFCFAPTLGLWRARTSANGDIVVGEDQLRAIAFSARGGESFALAALIAACIAQAAMGTHDPVEQLRGSITAVFESLGLAATQRAALVCGST